MATRTVTVNRRARHNYHILDSIEAGIALTGTEVKSIRANRVNMSDGYARPEDGELWLHNVHIARYQEGNRENHDPTRPRKLLLHRRQINDLSAKVMQKGFTIVPLRLYLKNGNAKVEVGLARGKRLYDKRQSIARRETEREMERTLKLTKGLRYRG